MSRTAWRRHRFTVLSAAAVLTGGLGVAAMTATAGAGPSALDYAQCSNGPLGSSPSPDCAWINGILNTNNSQFHEDEVTPQRLLVSYPDVGAGDHLHSVTLKYLDRKAMIHAYDSLASANATVSDALDRRCLGLSSTVCPDGTISDAKPVAPDPTVMPPLGTDGNGFGDVTHHMLTGSKSMLNIYGATFYTGPQDGSGITATPANPPTMTTPVHDPVTNCALCTGDDYASTTIYFKTSGSGVHNVQLLFGGHLAAEAFTRGWGTALGASSVNGGPYHIKWAAADGASVGNRDNQIMSNAIIQVAQGTSLSTTATPGGTTAITIGTSSLTTIYDAATLTVANASHPPTGTVTFDLYGPFATAPTAASCVDPDNTTVPVTVGNRLAVRSSSTWTQSAILTQFTANSSGSTVDLTATAGYGPGYYQWVAHYVPGTDAAYNTSSDGTCGLSSEQVHVQQATPTGASTQTITDTVTVTGFGTPTGHLDWYVYTDPTCTDSATAPVQPVWSDVWVSNDPLVDAGSQNNILSSGAATSEGFTPTPAASPGTTYYWKVIYSGDTNNAGPTTVETCGTQNVNVDNGS